jgi:ABC-type microcin C transport system duplicated ATPase subunit YejF
MQIVFQDPNSALNPKLRIGASLEEGLIQSRRAKKRAAATRRRDARACRDFTVPASPLSS